MVPARHSETNENKTVMGEIQNRDCQYLVESVIKLVTHNKSHLKLLPKAEIKIIKSKKYNYRVTRRVYASTYANMAEQFKIYFKALPADKIGEIKSGFRENGNSLFSFCQTESGTELSDSFAMFYYINDRPDGRTSFCS